MISFVMVELDPVLGKILGMKELRLVHCINKYSDEIGFYE